MPSRECPAHTQRVIHKESMLCHPTWQQLHVELMTHYCKPASSHLLQMEPNTSESHSPKKKATLTVWCEAQTQVQVTSNRAELAEARTGNPRCSHMELCTCSSWLNSDEYFWQRRRNSHCSWCIFCAPEEDPVRSELVSAGQCLTGLFTSTVTWGMGAGISFILFHW